MARSPWKSTAKRLVKFVLAILVLGAVGRHVARTWNDLRQHGETLHVEPVWLVVAGGLYLAGLTACGVFFGSILRHSPSPVALFPSVRAYLISHLGKYVPGKAMVVVMRVGLVTPYGARPATAAIATFYETLVMMASGSLGAVAGFACWRDPRQSLWLGISAALGLAFLVVVEPRVFPRVTRVATMPFPNIGPEAMPDIHWKRLGEGLILTLIGWILLGLSQVAVVRAFAPAGVSLRLWPVVAASVALATVSGFVVAVMPGGLGVREGVLMTTLAPAVGNDTAVVAALALRLVWVIAEGLAAGVLGLFRPVVPVAGASQS